MKTDLHNVDPELANVVPADEEEELVHGEARDMGMPVPIPDDNGYLW
jgi:hypothetical protein